MNIDKQVLDNYITTSPDYEDAFPTCPKCGRWECGDKNNYTCDVGDIAVCPECGHQFTVTDDNLLTLPQWEEEWQTVDYEYPDLSSYRVCPKCPGKIHTKEIISKEGYPGEEYDVKVVDCICECGFTHFEISNEDVSIVNPSIGDPEF